MHKLLYCSFIAYSLLCTASAMAVVNPCQVSDKEKIIRLLNVAGETESATLCAFWLAMEQAQQTNNYEKWKAVAVKNPELDQQYGFVAYLKTWQQAQQQQQVDTYKNFMQIKPNSRFNLNAIHAIYLLAKQQDKISAYRTFMTDFPDTPQAVDALLRIHELAYAKAREKDTPEYYDAFILTFPDAVQVPEAINLAFEAEKKQILGKLADKKCTLEEFDPLCDRLANGLFNKMLKDELATHIRNREYLLLKEDLFQYTTTSSNAQAHKIVTKLLEDIKNQLDENNQKVDEMKQSVIALIIAEHKQLTGLIQQQGQELKTTIQTGNQQLTNTIQQQGQELKAVIKVHHDFMAQQFVQVNHQLEQIDQHLTRVDENVQETNQQLEKIDKNVQAVDQHLTQVNENVNKVSQEINSLQQEQFVDSVLGAVPFGKIAKPIAKLTGASLTTMKRAVEGSIRAIAPDVTATVVDYLFNS
ncbi:hypothetical protein [Beggiatoa leptomitoformis]|uniref:t-SNARE coiled-coil homology domain-containing protein n=1 Tax=Beggiatoa leptomitoformis TaxID=288004 RepID=A0A2N9YDU3_9GAMM|nr:hypothetical protein [Beggiatoa leptomitoformis]ALG68966.1 hypothetical protein AL038_16285 [Beggiatoa leptomitoformis]AUI68644.1 hypothetical protein BLE401_07965 [Beggiatoa leptomitoformis]